MRRAVLPLLLALAALALVASGCGSKSSSSGLDTALSYVPKGAPLVVAVDTDPDGDQWQQVQKLIGKFPFGGQVKQQFKSGFNSRSSLDYDKDFKPLLGNDLVIAVSAASSSGTPTPYVAAWKVNDEAAAKRLIEKNANSKVGKIEGADVFESENGRATAIKDGTLVSAGTRAELEAAFKRAGGSDHMTEQDFANLLGDLDKDALVRVGGDFQVLLTGPEAAAARKVKWLAALRTFGFTVAAQSDGIEWAFDAKTEGALGPGDLPLAAGPQSAPVVRRAGEVGFGIRNLAQTVRFGEQVARITDPAGYAKYTRDKAKLSKQLGVNIDRDVIGQLTGNATVSVAVDGGMALRADVRDPAAAQATLKKAVPRLVKTYKNRGKSVKVTAPKGGKGFYTVASPVKTQAFGIIGRSFVFATDPARAAQIAGQSPTNVPGAKGALVVASDARSLANAIAKKQGAGTAAQIVTSALGDLIGYVESEPSGLTGSFKLHIK
jgi:uncharacterized protein DUF3352